jgi:hypothetical protein
MMTLETLSRALEALGLQIRLEARNSFVEKRRCARRRVGGRGARPRFRAQTGKTQRRQQTRMTCAGSRTWLTGHR